MLEDIRARTDIADLIGSYINLKRAGGTLKALCPFHKEKTPSFTVNPQRQIFHCFGCGAGGDVFGFMMKYEGVDFVGAIRLLAQRAGVALELEEGDREAVQKTSLYKLHEELAQFYRRCLLQTAGAAQARAYLASRDLPDTTGEEFLIGYAPDRWDSVILWAGKHKYSQDYLATCGLIVRSEKTPGRVRFYDRFRNRLMFPIRDEQNRVIGFSGRALASDEKGAKYVNSPETPLFHKGRVLYALEKARRHIVETREAILCEGQIDVIRCHMAGFTTAVASQGTAFTEEHARILSRYADSVALVFDPDKAGQNASIKAAAIFMEAGLAVRVVALPEKEDPDSFIRKQGADAFRACLSAAVSITKFQVDTLAARDDITTDAGATRVSQAVLSMIARNPNSSHRGRLLQEAAGLLNLPPQHLMDDLRSIQKRMRPESRRGGVDEARPDSSDTATPADGRDLIPPEERLLCEHLVCADQETAADVREHLPLDMLSSVLCRQFAMACLRAILDNRELQSLIRDTEPEAGPLTEFAAAIQMATSKIRKEYSRRQAVQDLILSIWRRELKRKRSTLGPDQRDRRHLTLALDGLKTWELGSSIIAGELAE